MIKLNIFVFYSLDFVYNKTIDYGLITHKTSKKRDLLSLSFLIISTFEVINL